jgi:hypothetical protein
MRAAIDRHIVARSGHFVNKLRVLSFEPAA